VENSNILNDTKLHQYNKYDYSFWRFYNLATYSIVLDKYGTLDIALKGLGIQMKFDVLRGSESSYLRL
jgi:hypothetical protein